MTELVVLRALLRVAQDLGGLVDLLELRLGLFVAGVQVGVVLLGELSVCLFYLFLRGALFKAEHLVIVAFLFRHVLHLALRAFAGVLSHARKNAGVYKRG